MSQEADAIVAASHILSRQGWAPAGAGNYSHRCPDGTIAITVSGSHKRHIGPDDVMTVDADGHALDARRPSAETLLHALIYRLFPQVQAVLHTHSVPAVVLSRLLAGQSSLSLAGYELLKAFPGVDTHDCTVTLPMFDNNQDMAALADRVTAALSVNRAPAFVIRGHGVYGWGRTMDEALRVVEATETLIACELEMLRMGGKLP